MRKEAKMPKERPILFSTEMVRAILAGTKTQTRRLVKDKEFLKYATDEETIDFLKVTAICPYGNKGDRLWVRETFGEWESLLGKYIYKANMSKSEAFLFRWKPAIHMPREASRINLVITDIRIERLHDITDQDAMDEGISMVDDYHWKDYFGDFAGFDFDANIKSKYGEKLSGEVTSYASLWSKINGLESWLSNPWVWVIEFQKEGGKRC